MLLMLLAILVSGNLLLLGSGVMRGRGVRLRVGVGLFNALVVAGVVAGGLLGGEGIEGVGLSAILGVVAGLVGLGACGVLVGEGRQNGVDGGGETERKRRALSAVTLRRSAAVLGITAMLVLVNVLAGMVEWRIDMSGSGANQLTGRSARLVDGLDGAYEVVVVADVDGHRTGSTRRAWTRFGDTLDALDLESSRVDVSVLDTGSSRGMRDFSSLLDRLVEREGVEIARQRDVLAAAIETLERAAARIDATSDELRAISVAHGTSPETQTARQSLEGAAASGRLLAGSLVETCADARSALESEIGETGVPDLQGAKDLVDRGLRGAIEHVGALARGLEAVAAAPTSTPEGSNLSLALSRELLPWQDSIARMRESAASLGELDTVRVLELASESECAIIIGPEGLGVTAIPLEETLAMLAQPDTSRIAESMLVRSLVSLDEPVRPVAVFVHAGTSDLLQNSTIVESSFQRLLSRLALLGFDIAEWVAARDDHPSMLDDRDAVYIVLGVDTAAAAPDGGMSGVERAERLGAVVGQLVADGKPVLLSLSPSTVPMLGEADPIVAALSPFGIGADTGTPLLRESGSAERRRVDAAIQASASEDTHPIADAVGELRLDVRWCVSLGATDESPPEVSRWPLVEVAADGQTWGESQWLGLWRGGGQASVLPEPDSSRDDLRSDGDVPWAVALAAQRSEEPDTQRLVVVGASGWFLDPIAEKRIVVDGRPRLASPGNSVLFESSLLWLAGRGDLLTDQSGTGIGAYVRSIDAGTLWIARWAIAIGLPISVLIAGLFWRRLER